MKVNSKYLSTKKISQMLDINERWLREHRDTIFIKGIHFHYPNGFNDCRWNVAAMIDWIENSSNATSNIANDILSTLCAS